MSERKSWDVQRSPKRSAPVSQPAPTRPQPRPARARPQQRPNPAPRQAPQTRPSPRRGPLPAGTLRERRNKRRRASRYVLLAILLLLVVGSFYLIWRPTFRIQAVSANGPGADSAKQIALSRISGTYLHIVPRNSTFFYPQSAIRAAILDAVPEVAAVSLKRSSFSGLEIHTIPREESFIWCGTTIDTPNVDGTCYEADIQGYIFKQANVDAPPAAAASTTASTTTATVKGKHAQVRVFGALNKELAAGQSPVRAHVVSPTLMPNALKFVDALRTLGAPVSALAIRGDEADLWLGGPIRITYVLGHEQDAAQVAASALPTLNLTNGSIQYIDLRFPGKAYVKKYGE